MRYKPSGNETSLDFANVWEQANRPFWINWANSEGNQYNMAILKKILNQSKAYYGSRERNDFK